MIWRWLLLAGGLAVTACAATPADLRTQEPPAEICGRTDRPQAVVSRTYLVFFDRGQATLTARARQVLDELAYAHARLGGDGTIQIQAHVDGAEAKTTHGLDLRRAVAVRDWLITDGIPVRALPMVADGFANPLVPTDASEPQNRYVSFFETGLGYNTLQLRRRTCAGWLRTACLTPHPTGSPEACEAGLHFLAP